MKFIRPFATGALLALLASNFIATTTTASAANERSRDHGKRSHFERSKHHHRNHEWRTGRPDHHNHGSDRARPQRQFK